MLRRVESVSSVDDDITDILKRYGINGYGDDKEKSPLKSRLENFNSSTCLFDVENVPKSTPTSTMQQPESNLNETLSSTLAISTSDSLSTSTRIDLTELFIDLDLNLCVSTPRHRVMQELESNRDTLRMDETLRNTGRSSIIGIYCYFLLLVRENLF